ncbi:hypothetical protein ElyMa_000927000 [Elysia marginata]|uniref:Uncharacterized protein n=1 Tax=Elysia marginata TaxID=1093978 RepID=A0AAV4H9Y8_9GAST|nr:hypothetical protein ElyMa_000927000 [Elysia marginata]
MFYLSAIDVTVKQLVKINLYNSLHQPKQLDMESKQISTGTSTSSATPHLQPPTTNFTTTTTTIIIITMIITTNTSSARQPQTARRWWSGGVVELHTVEARERAGRVVKVV